MSFLQRRAAPFLRPATASVKCRRSISLPAALKEHAPIDVHPEVREALAHNQPVVALETTIITHGMPYPTNRETALAVEDNVRKAGATPATIGLIEGRIKIGLEPRELERLADVSKNPSVVKLSRRDLGAAIALKKDGGTTCSTTLIIAALAGIKVFSTGGLGGVHRGAESTMDISADLHELTRCPVGLVSAGVKSILDIGRTLEYLETLGVPVISYGPTNDFPAFYTRKSGFNSPWRIDDPESAAQILRAHLQLGMSHGALFAVPIPEKYESVSEELQRAVEHAIRESEANGVSRRGKEATPWLLKRVGELTTGKSLMSNIALIENTATVGGQIAAAYSKLVRDTKPSHPHVVHPERAGLMPEPQRLLPPAKLVIVGSAAIDITARADHSLDTTQLNQTHHTTVPGLVSLTLGGVGRNVAEAAFRILNSSTNQVPDSAVLISPIGEDVFGQLLVSESERIGMRTDGLVRVPKARTAVCNMVLDNAGGLAGGVADMEVIRTLDAAKVIGILNKHKPSLLALDANMSPEAIKSLLIYASERKISSGFTSSSISFTPLIFQATAFFEPTSLPKSTVIFPAITASLSSASLSSAPVTFATPNVLELAHMYQKACALPFELNAHDYSWQVIDNMALGSEFRMELEQLARRQVLEDDAVTNSLSFLIEDGVAQMAINLLPFFQHLVIKCGDRGLITAFRISGEQAQSSSWAKESSNVHGRQIVAHNRTRNNIVVFKHFPPIRVAQEKIVNVTGAGDSLVGSMLATLSQSPKAFDCPEALDQLVAQAQLAAVYALQSRHAVSPRLSELVSNGKLN